MVHYTMTSELLSRVSEIVRSDLTSFGRRAKSASPEHISREIKHTPRFIKGFPQSPHTLWKTYYKVSQGLGESYPIGRS